MLDESKLEAIEQYKGQRGAILKDKAALLALRAACDYGKEASDWLGYSDSFTFRSRALQMHNVAFPPFGCSQQAKEEIARSSSPVSAGSMWPTGPVDSWSVEDAERLYITLTNARHRAKEVYITTDRDEIRTDHYADSHVGSGDVYYEKFLESLAKTTADKAWATFNGDTVNAATKGSAGGKEMQGDFSIARSLDFCELRIKPLLPFIGYIASGNHEANVIRDAGTAYCPALELCKRLGREDLYILYCGFVRWHITHSPSGITNTYVQYVHHGSGGGKATGAPLNKLKELADGNEADFYTMGHLHRDSAAGLDKRYTDSEGEVQIKGRLLVALPSFQALVDGNYAARAGYRPSVPGVTSIWLGAAERSMRTEIFR